MSWRDAPLYVRCHDFTRDLLARLEQGSSAPHATLRGATAGEALGLLAAVSDALAFPDDRAEARGCADAHANHLKVYLRVVRDLGVLDARGYRHVSASLVEIGRMIGGWRRRHAGPPETESPGSDPPRLEEAGSPAGEARDPRRLLEE